MTHPEFERLIERQFARSLSPEDVEVLQGHVRGCESCGRLYQRFSEAERALGGDWENISVLQRARIEEQVLSRVNRAASKGTRRQGRDEQVRSRWSIFQIVGVVAAASVALFVLVMPSEPSDEFTPRGGANPTLSTDIEIRALVVSPRVEGGFSVRPAAERSLQKDDYLRLVYRNDRNERAFEHVSVEVQVASGQRTTLVERQKMEQTKEGKLGEPIEASRLPTGVIQIRAVFFSGDKRPPPDTPPSDGPNWAVRTLDLRVE